MWKKTHTVKGRRSTLPQKEWTTVSLRRRPSGPSLLGTLGQYSWVGLNVRKVIKLIRCRLKPGDPHRRVRCQRCSTAFCWAWYGQWLKIKNSFNSEFKIELGISTLRQTVELSGHASGSETLQPLRIYRISSNLVESYLQLTLLCRYTLHSECFGQSQSQNQSRPKDCLQDIQKRSSMDYPPELFVVLQLNVLIVPWPLRSPRKFKLTFSITLRGLQSSFSHWQTNEKKIIGKNPTWTR